MREHGWELGGRASISESIHLTLKPPFYHDARDWAASWDGYLWTEGVYIDVPSYFEEELIKDCSQDRKTKRERRERDRLVAALARRRRKHRAEEAEGSPPRAALRLCTGCGSAHPPPIAAECPYQGEAPTPWERVKRKIFIDADRHRPAPHHRE